MSRQLQLEGPVQLATSVLKIKFYWNPVSPVRFHGVCGHLQAASAELPFKGNVMTSGAIDAGRGCSGLWVGRILEESHKLPQGPEDSEAFLQLLWVHVALARRPCTRAEPPGTRGPAELTQPGRVNLAARGPSAQTTAACLLSAAPRHQSGASSHVQAKQLLPITCLSPFSSPW